jgi:FtsZ-binding cell division protein ZapB
MTDGTTAVQVSPVTESEMGKVQDIFRRACDAIVGYSELGKQVQELTTKVEALTRELERLREDNKFMSEQLYETRKQRDEARADAQETHGALIIARNDISVAKADIEHKDALITSFRAKVATVERESDENLLRAMHAEEELAKVKAKLEEAETWFDSIRPILHPVVEPEPVPSNWTNPDVNYPETVQEAVAEAVSESPTFTPATPQPEEPKTDYSWPLPGYAR